MNEDASAAPREVDVPAVLEAARFGTLRWLGEDPAAYDSLYRAATRLFDLLAERKVDYVLVGGLAMLQYVEGRNTRDVDLVMALSDLRRLPELQVLTRDRDFANADFEGVRVDILLTENTIFREFRRRYVAKGKIAGRADIACATPEGLVFLKLFALPSLYRRGQTDKAAIYEADIRQLLSHSDIDSEALLAVLSTDMLASDVASLRVLVAEIRERITRGNPFGPGPATGPPA
ncbi:MAG: hypothetical protein HY875_06150 [Chloroflexi bacterium]|nr:hypothetical protein [Chloroflexota bacterium]